MLQSGVSPICTNQSIKCLYTLINTSRNVVRTPAEMLLFLYGVACSKQQAQKESCISMSEGACCIVVSLCLVTMVSSEGRSAVWLDGQQRGSLCSCIIITATVADWLADHDCFAHCLTRSPVFTLEVCTE